MTSLLSPWFIFPPQLMLYLLSVKKNKTTLFFPPFQLSIWRLLPFLLPCKHRKTQVLVPCCTLTLCGAVHTAEPLNTLPYYKNRLYFSLSLSLLQATNILYKASLCLCMCPSLTTLFSTELFLLGWWGGRVKILSLFPLKIKDAPPPSSHHIAPLE